MSTLYPQIKLTDPNFNYIPSAKTDIRETFTRFQPPKVQDLKEPLVEPNLPLGGFVLSAEWFEIVG
jgi:hypothetical protein